MRLGYRTRGDWKRRSWLGTNARGRLGTRLWRRLGWRDGSGVRSGSGRGDVTTFAVRFNSGVVDEATLGSRRWTTVDRLRRRRVE